MLNAREIEEKFNGSCFASLLYKLRKTCYIILNNFLCRVAILYALPAPKVFSGRFIERQITFMRILNISAQKPDSTGSGTYLAETVAAQVRAGHETAVICGIDAGDAIETLPAHTAVYPVEFMSEELPFHVCGMSDEMPYASTRYRDLTPRMADQFEAAFKARITRAVREFEPDVVLCHHLYFVSTIVREQVVDIPVAAICHATDLRQMAMHDLKRERIISAMRNMDAIFALHGLQVEKIKETYGVDDERIHITGTGYNAQVFNEEGSAPTRTPATLVYVGKISFKKGVESLLAALNLISPEDIAPYQLKVKLVGGHNPQAQDFKRIAAEVPRNRWDVELAGRIPTSELVQTYRESDVFVLPSFYEGLPLVGIEALACGCKVLMTALPGVREGMDSVLPGNPMQWVEPPAMVAVDTPDSAALPAFEERLAKAIVDAVNTPAQPFDVTHASWDTVVSRMLTTLEGLL